MASAARDVDDERLAEASAGVKGIGELLKSVSNAAAASSDVALRNVVVFCAGASEASPALAAQTALADEVSAFLRHEDSVARDLRIYAEALDPGVADMIAEHDGRSQDHAKLLLRVFSRYATCRLGEAVEVASAAAAGQPVKGHDTCSQQAAAAEHLRSRLDQCTKTWWATAVRCS